MTEEEIGVEGIKAMLLNQCRCYPGLQPGDLLKALHQSVMGCGHLVTDEAGGWERLCRELEECRDTRGIEMLSPAYCRVHLGFLKESGLAPESLFRLFVLSAEEPLGCEADLEEGIQSLLELAEAGEIPFSRHVMAEAAEAWRRAGFPACRHSPEFRELYRPAYRVIRWDFVWKLHLLAAIDRLRTRKERVLVAIEGGAGSGKTTLARWLSRVYDCSVFHVDDYFLRPEQRTPERLAEVGGNLDRERFLEEVLLPLSRGETVRFARYDCHTQSLLEPVETAPKALSIIEGAYSMHPLLADYYDLKAFLETDPEEQRRRILKRNGPEMAERFFSTWIPMENRYFEAMGIRESCHVILKETK